MRLVPHLEERRLCPALHWEELRMGVTLRVEKLRMRLQMKLLLRCHEFLSHHRFLCRSVALPTAVVFIAVCTYM